jgi:TolA-binding protein
VAGGAAAEGKVEAGRTHPRADLPPDQWLARIDELRRQGKHEEARTSLAEFRKRYPDYEPPATLKNWGGP